MSDPKQYPDRDKLLELAARCEAATRADRELDAEIAEHAYGWKPVPVPPDANGENAGEVLTEDGKPFTYNGKPWSYPPLGKIGRAYHCPEYTRDCADPAFPRNTIRKMTADTLRGRAQASEARHG